MSRKLDTFNWILQNGSALLEDGRPITERDILAETIPIGTDGVVEQIVASIIDVDGDGEISEGDLRVPFERVEGQPFLTRIGSNHGKVRRRLELALDSAADAFSSVEKQNAALRKEFGEVGGTAAHMIIANVEAVVNIKNVPAMVLNEATALGDSLAQMRLANQEYDRLVQSGNLEAAAKLVQEKDKIAGEGLLHGGMLLLSAAGALLGAKPSLARPKVVKTKPTFKKPSSTNQPPARSLDIPKPKTKRVAVASQPVRSSPPAGNKRASSGPKERTLVERRSSRTKAKAEDKSKRVNKHREPAQATTPDIPIWEVSNLHAAPARQATGRRARPQRDSTVRRRRPEAPNQRRAGGKLKTKQKVGDLARREGVRLP